MTNQYFISKGNTILLLLPYYRYGRERPPVECILNLKNIATIEPSGEETELYIVGQGEHAGRRNVALPYNEVKRIIQHALEGCDEPDQKLTERFSLMEIK